MRPNTNSYLIQYHNKWTHTNKNILLTNIHNVGELNDYIIDNHLPSIINVQKIDEEIRI